MRISFEQILAELSNDSSYSTVKDSILTRFKDYDKLTADENQELWSSFFEYIIQKGWTRKYAYVFCLELFSNKNISEQLKSEFDEFYSMLIGNGILTDTSIRFKGEPTDLSELDNYIHSDKWFD